MEVSDREVIIKIKQGEIDQFSYIVKKYTQQIFPYVSVRIYNICDRDDIIQNTFLHFYRAIARFDENKPVVPYLFQIVRNELKMYYRSHKSTFSLDDRIYVPDEKDILDLKEFEMEDLTKTLTGVQKHAVQLLYEGYSYKEIAIKLKKPLNTIKSLIHRARLQVKKANKQQHEKNTKT